MLSRITGQASYCAERAETCRQLANDITYDATSRADFREMELRWLRLAQSYDLIEELSGYLQWQCQRIDPPPDFEPLP
jgi:hypothetical protein